MITYHLERSGGQWEGRFWSTDEDRYYRKTWDSPGKCEAWCKANQFHFVLVN